MRWFGNSIAAAVDEVFGEQAIFRILSWQRQSQLESERPKYN